MKRSSATPDLYTRGAAFDIPGELVDGMDVQSVKKAGLKAVEHCRSGKGPYILEMKTYRYRGHSMSDPARYRTRQEVNKIKEEQDPIDLVKNIILTKKYASDEELKSIDNEIKKLIIEAAEFAQQSSEPDPSELWTDVYREVGR